MEIPMTPAPTTRKSKVVGTTSTRNTFSKYQPTETSRLISKGPTTLQWQHVTDIDLHCSSLLDQTNSKHKAMSLLLPQQNPAHTLKGTSHNFHCHSFMKIGMRIIGQDARHQPLKRRDFFFRDGFRPLPST